jgi:hypothetical protein
MRGTEMVIDGHAVARMLAGAEKRVETWREIDNSLREKGKLGPMDHSSGFGYHEGQRRLLVQIQEMAQ